MPEPLEREVIFDIAPALAALQDLDSAFEASAQAAASAYADAIATALTTPIDIPDVVVEADASAIPTEIDTAVAAADTVVGIEADAAGVTSELDNAIGSSDTSVELTAETSQVTAAIDSLEGTEVSVAVVADAGEATSELTDFSGAADKATESTQGLSAASGQLGFATGVAAGGASSLAGTVGKLLPAAGAAGLAVAGLVGFTELVVDKAASAETATRRLEDAFGDEAEAVTNIDIEGFNGSLTDLANAAGSSGKKMKSAAADVGVLGSAAGFTTEETAKTAQQILVLAARAVALKPSLGDAGDVAERLQKALASGRDKALIPYGIALDKTATAAEAARIATDHGRDSVSVFDKVAAAASVTTQGLGKHLGEDIAKGANDAELQMRSLQIQVGAALVEIGKPLVAPFIATLENSLPVIESFGTALGQIAEGVLPVLPALLGAVVPPLQLLADIVSAIPTPLITAAAAFALLSRALPAVQAGIGLLAPSLGALANPIGLAVVGLGALVIALQSFGGSSRDAAKEAKTMADILFGQIESATGLQESLDKLNSSFDDYIKNTVDLGSESEVIIKAQKQLGITNDELFAALRGSDSAFKKFSDNIFDASLKLSDNALIGDEVVKQLKEERQNLQAAGKASVDRAVANGLVSQSFADQAVKLNTAKKGGVDYVTVLKEIDKQALAVEESQKKVAQATADSSDEFALLRDKVIHGLDVSAEVDAFAEQFGVAAEDVKAQLDPLAQTVSGLLQSAVAQLPTATDAIAAFGAGIASAYGDVANAASASADEQKKASDTLFAALDPQRLIDQLNEQIKATAEFSTHLTSLLQKGAKEAVAAILQAGDAGPQVAAQLDASSPEILQSANTAFGQMATGAANSSALIQNTIIPAIVDTATVKGAEAAGGFLGNFKLEPGVAAEMAATEAAITNSTVNVITGGKADQASIAYAEKFLIRHASETEMDATASSISGNTAVPGAAATTGGATSDAFGGALKLDEASKTALTLATQKFLTENGAINAAALGAGRGVGHNFDMGIKEGIETSASQVTEAAKQIVRDAKSAADRQANANSPSKLFMEVGRDLGEGLAVGLKKQTANVERASQQLVTASVGTFEGLSLTAPTLSPKVAAAATVGGAGGVNNSTLNFDVSINVNGAMSTADARAAAETFASEAEIALMRRNVIARVRAV